MAVINTALLSFGMSGQVFHAPFLQHLPGFNLYAVWERTKNIAQAKYPSIKTYRTLNELLNDSAIELVVVNTPNITHYEYAKKSLMAGKHVVVEKPFTVNVEEAEELIQLATKNNLILSVYHNRRYDSDFKTTKKIIDEKILGEIVEAEFHFDRYKVQLNHKQHKEIPGGGTGALYDLGSHLIDQSLQLFGLPEAVFADIRILRPGSVVDDYFEVLLYYPNCRVRLHCSYLVKEPVPAYQLYGTKGSFLKVMADVQEQMLQSGYLPGSNDWGKEPEPVSGLLHTEKNGEVIRERVPSERGNYGEYYELLYESIKNNGPVPVPAKDGQNVIRIILKAIQSSQEKRVIPF